MDYVFISCNVLRTLDENSRFIRRFFKRNSGNFTKGSKTGIIEAQGKIIAALKYTGPLEEAKEIAFMWRKYFRTKGYSLEDVKTKVMIYKSRIH